jgi:ubiquinone/menaquinone biosynthesis C-methylase UbiE
MKGIIDKFFDEVNNIKKNKRDFLLELMPKNSISAEVGVWKGEFSKKILKIVQPKELHLIDPWKFESEQIYKNAWYGRKIGSQNAIDQIYDFVTKQFCQEVENNRVFIHRNLSTNTGNSFSDNYFDWVYIDGNHLYEFVKKDLELFYRKVKKGGYICGDDYEEGGWWKGGVKKAVDEFLQKGTAKKIKIKNKQFILKKIE